MLKQILLPLTQDKISLLKPGDAVELTGVIYTARDIAHRRLVELIIQHKKLPFDLTNQVFYYCGPTPAKPGKVIGAAGPTTSSRMDTATPSLLKMGLKGMIGKGPRSAEVAESIKKHHAVYFVTYAGAAAYLSKFVKKSEIVAFSEYGPESVRRLVVENFPVTVSIK
jgi:fumarate hydratase subunit beta